jgi:hypothetical protein
LFLGIPCILLHILADRARAREVQRVRVSEGKDEREKGGGGERASKRATTRTRARTHAHAHTNAQANAHARTHTHACTHACTRARAHTHVYTCTCIHTYIRTCPPVPFSPSGCSNLQSAPNLHVPFSDQFLHTDNTQDSQTKGAHVRHEKRVGLRLEACVVGRSGQRQCDATDRCETQPPGHNFRNAEELPIPPRPRPPRPRPPRSPPPRPPPRKPLPPRSPIHVHIHIHIHAHAHTTTEKEHVHANNLRRARRARRARRHFGSEGKGKIQKREGDVETWDSTSAMALPPPPPRLFPKPPRPPRPPLRVFMLRSDPLHKRAETR